MCGRLSLFTQHDLVADRFDADPIRPIESRYNVTPGQAHPVIQNDDSDTIQFPTWGLVPEWADGTPSSGHFNARAETLAEKPSFSEAFADRRCLVLVDGFYDWKETPTGKQPYRFEREDRAPFALAGLWEPASDDSESFDATFTVVTTEPNAVVEPIHHRMPVVLDPDEERQWLQGSGGTGDGDDATPLLDPNPTPEMHAYPVSSALNDPKNDSPDLLEAVPAEEDVQTGLGDF